MANTNITEMTSAQIQELLEMKRKLDEKKAKQASYNERRRVWMKIMIDKAKAAGIEVSDDEVNAELAK